MTSRNLFSKLMREDLKRRLWAIGFSVLALFFAMPMAAAMGIGSIGNQYKEWLVSGTGYDNITPDVLRQTKILRLAGEILGFENYFLFFLIGAAAMVLGLTGFLYLHSKKQVDFYNCLPVKRETMFAVKFLDGFLIILAAYFINMFAAFGILCGNGVAAGDIFQMMFASFAVNMIGFLLIYTVMVIAVLLTGNLFISILGAGVLYGYMPAVSLLIESLKSLFFVTQGRGTDVYWLARYGSPIGYFTKMADMGRVVFHTDQFYDDIDYGFRRIQMNLQSTANGANLLKCCVIGLLAAVILTVIALVLYKIRPSEAAGKAMAFKKTQAPIKILLLVPMTVTTTVFLWSIYYSIVWAAVGFVLGLVLSSCIIEIIYHFDFAKLFANPVQTVVGGVLAILVVGFFWSDAFGYDSYIPDEKNFESASINMNLDSDVDYGLPYRDGDSYRWRYMNPSDYADANMKITDYAAVRAIAEKAVENAKLQRSRKLNGDSSYSYNGDDDYMIYVQAGYRQKNGKTVYRSYSISRAALGSTMDEIYATKEYKEGVYPVMSYQPENITGIYWLSDSNISELHVDEALRAQILSAYQEELAGLTINERAVEVPVAALRFLTKAEEEYLCTISAQRGYASSGFRMEDMNAVNFFPVYPSFTKTIDLLKQAGVDVNAKISADDVAQLKILYPVEYEASANGADAETSDKDVNTVTSEGDAVAGMIDGNSDVVMMETAAVSSDYDSNQKSLTIVNDGSEENRKKIEEILSYSVPENMLERNRLCTYESGIEIDVSIKPDSAFSSGNGTVDMRIYRIKGEKVPECLEKALNYSKIDVKSVMKGIGVLEND